MLGAENGIYSTFYRNYDPTIGRFQGVDPLADKYADESPYSFGFNDPINFNDPNGDEPPRTYHEAVNQMYGGGWYEQHGRGGTNAAFYGSSAFGPPMGTFLPGSSGGANYYESSGYNNRLLSSAISLIQSALPGLGLTSKNGQTGFYRKFTWNGAEPSGKGTIKSGITLGEVTSGAEFMPIGLTGAVPVAESVLTWIGLDYSIPDPTDAALLKHAVYAVVGGVAATVAYRSLRQGVQYKLIAKRSGFYPVMDWGRKNPVGVQWMPAGAVWRIGETLQWDPANQKQWRYSNTYLDGVGMGLRFVPEYQGNKAEIFMREQQELLMYLYQNGSFPAGNKGWK